MDSMLLATTRPEASSPKAGLDEQWLARPGFQCERLCVEGLLASGCQDRLLCR